jgi:hypothetical protein
MYQTQIIDVDQGSTADASWHQTTPAAAARAAAAQGTAATQHKTAAAMLLPTSLTMQPCHEAPHVQAVQATSSAAIDPT